MRHKKLNCFSWAVFGGVKNGRNLLTKNQKLTLYTYIQKKSCPDKYLVGLYFGQVGGPDKKNQKHPVGRIFFKSY